MELQYLDDFVRFSCTLNLSETARSIHLSVSALSAHIASLEKDLQCQLVVRDKEFRLTPAGQILAKRAPKLLEDWMALKDEVIAGSRENCELSICAPASSSLAYRSFQAFLGRFLAENPRVNVRLVESSLPTVRQTLEEAGVDCVVIPHRLPGDDAASPLCFVEIPQSEPGCLGIWADPSHPLSGRSSLKWEDLQGVKYAVPGQEYPLWRKSLADMLDDHGVEAKPVVIVEKGINFLRSMDRDVIALYDEGIANDPTTKIFTSRVFVPLDEQDAAVHTYIAYDPSRTNVALERLLLWGEENGEC